MNTRYEELDSLRGLAAVAVVLAHAIAISGDIPLFLDYSPLHFFWASHEAVIFFFVLSGFVLSLPYYKNKKINYLSYITKRITRIYLPYLVAVTVTFIVFSLFARENITGLGEWVAGKWSYAPDFKILLEHFLLIGNYQTSDFNPVIWSLIHEMRISIFFPLIMLLILKRGLKTSIGVALVLSVIGGLNDVFQFDVSQGWNTSFMDTLHYSSMFIIGALLAKNISTLKSFYRRMSNFQKLTILAVGFFAYTYSRAVRIVPTDFMEVIADWGIALGVIVFILASLSSEVISESLKKKPLLINGSLSYSCYLYHCIVLLALFHVYSGVLNTIVLYVISIPLIYAVSYISWRYIELPSIKLGKYLTEKTKSTSLPVKSEAGLYTIRRSRRRKMKISNIFMVMSVVISFGLLASGFVSYQGKLDKIASEAWANQGLKQEKSALVEKLDPRTHPKQPVLDFLRYQSLVKDEVTISLFGGDSLYGVNGSLLRNKLQSSDPAFTSVTVHHHGFGHYSTSDLLKENKLLTVIKTQPDLVLFETAIIANQKEAVYYDQTNEDIQTIVSELKSKLPNSRIVIISANPTADDDRGKNNPMGYTRQGYLDRTKTFIEEAKWEYFDVNAAMKTKLKEEQRSVEDILADDIHLNDEGNAMWSDVLFDYFQRVRP